jgi:hypothetical protein
MLGAKLGIQSRLNAPFKKENLWGWYDANSGTYYDSSNNMVAWYDKSGNGNTMWHFNGAPQNTDSVADLNNMPGVAFDGTDDFCYTDDGHSIISSDGDAAAFTVFIVISQINIGAYEIITGFEDQTNSRIGSLQVAAGVGTAGRVWAGSNSNTPYKDSISLDNLTTTPSLLIAVSSGDSSTGNMLIQNGTDKFDGTLNSNYTAGLAGTSNLCIANRYKTNHAYLLDAYVAECIWFDAALSSDDRADVATYLNNKYDLY